jgi:hypothetical protein
MRAAPFILAALVAALPGVSALAQETATADTPLGRMGRCFEGTPYRYEVAEEHTSLGGHRTVVVERGTAQLDVVAGTRIVIRGAYGKPTASLWIEQSPLDKLADNKRVLRDHLLWVIDRSGAARPEHRGGNGIEVMSLEKRDVEGTGYVSQHHFFHDASGIMVSARIFRQKGGERDYRTPEEYQQYRNALFGQLVGCLRQLPQAAQ